MKKIILALSVSLAAVNASADVGGFIGITYVFGANAGAGITLQATSNAKGRSRHRGGGGQPLSLRSQPEIRHPGGRRLPGKQCGGHHQL